MSRWDRFWQFALDHPWKFAAGFWAIYLGVAAIFFVVGIPSVSLGWLIGGSFGAIRIVWQSFGIARDNRRWNDYLAGKGTYR